MVEQRGSAAALMQDSVAVGKESAVVQLRSLAVAAKTGVVDLEQESFAVASRKEDSLAAAKGHAVVKLCEFVPDLEQERCAAAVAMEEFVAEAKQSAVA